MGTKLRRNSHLEGGRGDTAGRGVNVVVTGVCFSIEHTFCRICTIGSGEIFEFRNNVHNARVGTETIGCGVDLHRRVHRHGQGLRRQRTVAVRRGNTVGQRHNTVIRSGVDDTIIDNGRTAARSLHTILRARPSIGRGRRVIGSRGDIHVAAGADRGRGRHRDLQIGSAVNGNRSGFFTAVGILHRQGIGALGQMVEFRRSGRISTRSQRTDTVLVVNRICAGQVVEVAEAGVLHTTRGTGDSNLTVIIGAGSRQRGCRTNRDSGRLAHRHIQRSRTAVGIRGGHRISGSIICQTAEGEAV